MLEVYRPGVPGDRFIDPLSEVAARLIDFTVTDDVKPVGVMDRKFARGVADPFRHCARRPRTPLPRLRPRL